MDVRFSRNFYEKYPPGYPKVENDDGTVRIYTGINKFELDLDYVLSLYETDPEGFLDVFINLHVYNNDDEIDYRTFEEIFRSVPYVEIPIVGYSIIPKDGLKINGVFLVKRRFVHAGIGVFEFGKLTKIKYVEDPDARYPDVYFEKRPERWDIRFFRSYFSNEVDIYYRFVKFHENNRFCFRSYTRHIFLIHK
jgi:hypothetical protein